MKNYVDAEKLQEYTTKLVAKLKEIFPGPAQAASTVAEMTDESKVYVYTGSETGYTAGNWYYWDGTAWTSGGVYNAVQIETDTTLTETGEAADAKATGDAIAAAKAAVLADLAPAYSTSATYAVGAYVVYNGGLYRCITAISTAEAWTAAHWTAVDLANDVGASLADLKSAIDEIPEEPVKNLFDPQGLLDAGWTVSDGVYSGTPKALVTKWDAVYPLNHYTFKAGVRYTISLYANRDTSADGTGMVVAFTYTDASTKTVLYMPNSTTTSTAFTLTSKSAHDVASIYFAFSSLGDATWHIKDVMLVEGTTAQEYEPFALTAVDNVARGNASSLISQVTALSDSVSHVVTLPRGTNPLYVPQGATIKITNNSATTNGSATAYDMSGTEIEQISANIRQGASVLYTAPQNVGSIRFYSTDTSATATVTFMDTLDERVNTLESYHANPIPSYFQTAIETATTTVKNRMMGVGKEGDTFVFITDIHWENNRKHSPALIKYLIDHLNINKIICGGDLITQGEREAMSNDMLECIKAFTFPDVMLPTVFGNHDSNWNNYGTQRQDPTRRFDINAVYSLICKQAEPYVTFMTDYDCSFYFDNDNCNTRYICLDTGEDDSNYRYFTAFDELADALNGTPNGYNIVIIAHIVTYGVFNTYVEPMLDAYNAKTTYEYDGTTYDFTSATGHVVIGIGGHTHEDSDHTTTGGIPIVVVTCDLFNADSTEGTVTEQAFDVVTLDYANDTAYFDRVGKGVSRTFTLG